jgi:hypothetical protein
MALTDDLIAWWTLDETSGTRYDSHGTHHLTDTNTVTYSSSAKYGNAAEFEWTNQESLYKACPTTDELAFYNEDNYSVVSWVYPMASISTVGDDMKLVAKSYYSGPGDNKSHWGTLIFDDSGHQNEFGAEIRGTTDTTQKIYASTFGSLSLNTWYFCYFYHDAGNNQLGVSVNNGTVDTQSWSNGTYNAEDGQFNLGIANNFDPIEPYDGRMDETAIWGRVLTSSEVTELYNSGSGLTYEDIAEEDGPIWIMSTNGWWDKLNGILQPKQDILVSKLAGI